MNGSGHAHSPRPLRFNKQWWLEGCLIVAFWGIIIMLNLAQWALDPRGGRPGGLLRGEVTHVVAEHGVWIFLTPGIFWLSRRFRLEGDKLVRHLLLYAAVALAVAVATDVIGHITFHNFVNAGRRGAISPFRSLSGLFFLDELIIYLVVLSAGFARDYFLRYQAHLVEAAQLRTDAANLHAQLAEARLQALRMQLNPHFLFNTLHTISTYIERDPRGVRRMIARLSELLRYTLEMTEMKEVTLRQELGFLDGYLEIQSIRFQDSLEVRREIAPDVLDALVPNLILQPILENAIKHGVSNLEVPGRITLSAWRDKELLHLSVQDNGPGLTVSSGDGAPASNGIGLRNTRERLESLYGSEQSLVMEPADGGGLVARISLPYHTAADLFTSVA